MTKCSNLIEELASIGIEFGMDKCAKKEIKYGKPLQSVGIKLQHATEIRSLYPNEVYKYLGMDESDGINDLQLKDKVKKEYYRRLRQTLATQLTSKNKITAVQPSNPVSFGVLDWLRPEIHQIDRKTKKILTMGGAHHSRADVDRLYIKRRNGGRCLLEIEAVYDQTMVGLADYLEKDYCNLMKAVKTNDCSKNKHFIKKHADKVKTRYLMTEAIPGLNSSKELKEKNEREKIEQ